MKNRRFVSLALALVLVLSMTASAFALPDGYVHDCPKPENPFKNSSAAYVFAKLVPDTCSIWVYGMMGDEKAGNLKGLAVFKYTEDAKVIEMVAYQNVYGFYRRGANLQITEPGRYFAAVVDKQGLYAVWPQDFVVTQEMIDAVSGSIEN